MACRDYKALIPRYVDGELPPEQARLLKDHLPACDSCRGTIRLLRMEDRAIRGALLGPGSRGAVGRPPVRLVRAALICGILLGVATVVLYGTYRGLAEKVEAAKQNEGPDLSLTVRVQADGIPLEQLLEQISDRTGVEVVLTEEARERLPDGTQVHIALERPIRLGSLLDLVADFYGLDPETEGGAVHLR